MADTKISALPASTLPLAGTEVLPIVQSSTTKKVAADDLTVKNVRSNATNGILQIAGPAAAATRTMTVPDANFTAARIDAAQSFTGDQTLATGNIIQGTAAKGINFTANTPLAGMTSQLLNWYEEGTWTPTAGTFTVVGAFTGTGTYIRIGKQVTVTARLNAATSIACVAGQYFDSLPFTSSSAANIVYVGGSVNDNIDQGGSTYTGASSTRVYSAVALAARPNLFFTLTYFV